MKFEDLVWYVNFYRNKFKTNKNINIFLTLNDFESLGTNGLKYFVKWNFTICIDYSSINPSFPKNNHGYVNTDRGGEYFEIFSENERIIKQLLE